MYTYKISVNIKNNYNLINNDVKHIKSISLTLWLEKKILNQRLFDNKEKIN